MDEKLLKEHPHNVPEGLLDEVKDHLEHMLNMGAITLNINFSGQCQVVTFYSIIMTTTYVHSVPHNSNSLISNYRLFQRPPSAPKITPLTT